MKVVVFGDTGGHYRALRDALATLGVKDFKLPEDVHVVHLGDLVHRGPNSNAVVNLVDSMMHNNPGRWSQLIGNHEAMHLDMGVSRFFRCNCSAETIETLQTWDSDSKIIPATAILGVQPRKWTNGNRPIGQEELVADLLCTHGGLTYDFWSDELESPLTATEAAFELYVAKPQFLTREGIMTMGFTGRPVGPIWAAAGEEVAKSWIGKDMPFSQAVGHTTPFSFDYNEWRSSVPKEIREVGKGIPEERRSVIFGTGGVILCQDPGYGARDIVAPQPYLELEATLVTL